MVIIDRIRFSQNLLHYREVAGLTRYALARRLGVALTQVTRWETATCLPGLDSAVQLCVVLHIEPSELLDGCILTDPPGPGGERQVAA